MQERKSRNLRKRHNYYQEEMEKFELFEQKGTSSLDLEFQKVLEKITVIFVVFDWKNNK